MSFPFSFSHDLLLVGCFLTMSISLCLVVHATRSIVEAVIASARDIVDEVVIVDQASPESLMDLATIYHRTTRKGWADPDRQWCYELAPTEWILALDGDERCSPAVVAVVPELLQEQLDVVWFPFWNTCDGVDLTTLLGEDYHPRLFKKGACVWPQSAHQFPQFTTGRHGFLPKPLVIEHHRTHDQILAAHTIRTPLIDPSAQHMEKQFLENLDRLLATVNTHGSYTH